MGQAATDIPDPDHYLRKCEGGGAGAGAGRSRRAGGAAIARSKSAKTYREYYKYTDTY